MTVYLIFPALAALCGLVKKKTPVCLLCGIMMFFFLTAVFPPDSPLIGIYEALPRYPVSMMNRLDAPIGFLFPAKLISMLYPSSELLPTVLAACFSLGTMIYIYRSCEAPAVSILLVSAGGFLLTACGDPCLFAAALIAAYAFRYVGERRFLRFAALILLASCFSPEALLLLLLYFILIPPPCIFLLLGGAALSAVLLFTDAAPFLYGFLYGPAEVPLREDLSPVFAVTLGILSLFAALLKPLLPKNKKREYGAAINLLFAAAFLSLVGIYEPFFTPLMIMTAFAAVPILGGTAVKTVERLIALTFREKKKPVRIVCAAVGAGCLTAWYLWLLYDHGIWFGTGG